MKTTIIIGLLVGTTATAWGQLGLHKDSISAGSIVAEGPSITAYITAGIPEAGSFSGPSNRGWLGFYPIDTARTTSVQEVRVDGSPVHPNPSAYQVHFPVTEPPQSLQIITEQGAVLEGLPWSSTDHEGTVDVRTFASGTYTLVVHYRDRLQRFRFVVLH